MCSEKGFLKRPLSNIFTSIVNILSLYKIKNILNSSKKLLLKVEKGVNIWEHKCVSQAAWIKIIYFISKLFYLMLKVLLAPQ